MPWPRLRASWPPQTGQGSVWVKRRGGLAIGSSRLSIFRLLVERQRESAGGESRSPILMRGRLARVMEPAPVDSFVKQWLVGVVSFGHQQQGELLRLELEALVRHDRLPPRQGDGFDRVGGFDEGVVGLGAAVVDVSGVEQQDGVGFLRGWLGLPFRRRLRSDLKILQGAVPVALGTLGVAIVVPYHVAMILGAVIGDGGDGRGSDAERFLVAAGWAFEVFETIGVRHGGIPSRLEVDAFCEAGDAFGVVPRFLVGLERGGGTGKVPILAVAGFVVIPLDFEPDFEGDFWLLRHGDIPLVAG